MDTCLVLSELDSTSAEAGLKKAKEYLRRFSFMEEQYDKEEQHDPYQEAITKAAEHWKEYREVGLHDGLVKLLDQPYEWLRLMGRIEIEDVEHGIQLFLYPVSGTKANLSIAFASTVHAALYSFRPFNEEVIDLDMKKDIVSLVLLMARGFSPGGFALKSLTEAEDLVMPLRTADIREWLVAATEDTIRRWPFMLAGIRAEMVERSQVEKNWPGAHLLQSSAGFLIYDGIYSPNHDDV